MIDWVDKYKTNSYNINYPFEDVIRFIVKYSKPGDAVFELGCGSGNHFQLYNDHGLFINGNDISIEALQRAAARIPLVKMNLYNVKFSELIKSNPTKEEYDLVVDRSALCCDPEGATIIPWLKQSMKPGGYFLSTSLRSSDVRVYRENYFYHYSLHDLEEEGFELLERRIYMLSDDFLKVNYDWSAEIWRKK